MALNVGQPFKRTSKGQRFEGDVMTKAQMLLGDDTQYEDGYLVVESESHDLYIYNSSATPSAETGKFVKKGPEGTPTISQVLTAGNNIENQSISGHTITTEPGYTIVQDMSLNKSSCTIHKLQTPEEGLADRWTVDIGVNQIQMSTNKGKTSKSLLRINTSDIENPVVTMSENMKTAWKTTLDINGSGIQVTTLPTASATEEGNIYQYVGATDSNYTNGYFYQCQEVTPATDPKTYEWVQKDVQSSELPEGGTAEQILAKKTDENGNVEWIEDIGRSLTQFDRKYGIIPANVPITVRVAEFVRETYTNTEYRVPYGGIITSPSSISSGILNTFDAYVVVSGYSESKVKEYVSATNSYRLENSLMVKLDPITQSGNYAGIQAKETSNDRKVTSIRLVARGDNNFGMGDGTAPYDIRNLTGMVLDDLRVTGTAIPTDWGIAGTGREQIATPSDDGIGKNVDISGFGLSSVDDYEVSLIVSGGTGARGGAKVYYSKRSETQFSIGVYRNGSDNTRVDVSYTIFAKGYGNNRMQSGGGSLPSGGTTGQALVKKSNTDGDVEWKTVGGESTIDKIKVNNVEQTITDKTVNIEAVQFNGTKLHGQYADATLSGGVTVSMDFTPTTDGMQYKTEYDDGIIHTTTKDLVDKTYVDSKSPTIVNEGATFSNASGNQKMQIRTGSTNSVIIKDTNGDGTTEYWSYELPDKDYVDTEIAKRNAVVNFDNEYKTLQIRDVDNNLDFQIVKETSNDYIRVNEYAKDDRGQMQQIFDVNLPTKTYVDTLTGDLGTLTTTDTSSLVNAINEVYEKSGEPFRVKNWASSWSAGIEIDPCTTDKTNANLSKMTYSIDAVEGADYQIVGMVAYEVFDNTSGGNRLNVWPVCQFTGNGQKELSVRWVCAGTTVKTAKRINAWVLLKHR